MKQYIILIMGLALILSCQPETEELPENMEELEVLHRDTKKEIAQLEGKLTEIENKMSSIDPTVFELPTKLVTGLSLNRGSFERFIELQGSVKADETVYISSESGGRILDLTVRDGDFVAKGKLIARIDLEELNKRQQEIEKSLELARQVFERQERLWNQNIGTELQYLQAKNNVEQLEKNIETVEYQKTKSNIYAPISGEISMLSKERGEVVGPGEPIATILNTRKLDVVIDLPENLLPKVNRGDDVTVRIPAINYEEKLRISRIGAQVNPTNRTIPIEVDIYNSNGNIKPNLLATMLVKDYEQDSVLTIPTTLLQQEVSGRYFVYTVDDSGDKPTVKKSYVKVGESHENSIIVNSGLTADDVLIDKGARQVQPGEHLEVESIRPIAEVKQEEE